MPKMSELVFSLGRMLILLAIVYALSAVVANFMAPGMIFPHPPVTYQLTPDYIQLTTPDGVKLAARHWPNPSAKYTLLYLHGNYEELGSLGEYLPHFVSAGYAVFAVEHRRHGLSGGTAARAGPVLVAPRGYR